MRVKPAKTITMSKHLLLMGLLLAATLPLKAQVVNLDSNLVAYYSFSGTTVDDSPNTNDVQLLNTVQLLLDYPDKTSPDHLQDDQ